MRKPGTIALSMILIIGASAGAAFAGPTAAAQAAPVKVGGFFSYFGMSFSNLAYDSESKKYLADAGITNKRRLGFHVGFGYEIPLGRNLTLAPGIFYLSAGDKLTADTGEAEQIMNGILVPIDLKMSFNGPFFSAGPYLGYITSAKFVLDDGTSEEITEINKVHYGISVGAGYELPLKSMTLMIKLGAQFGLSNIAKTETSEDTNRAKHSAFTAMVGLRI